jgi:hypothetical protein
MDKAEIEELLVMLRQEGKILSEHCTFCPCVVTDAIRYLEDKLASL